MSIGQWIPSFDNVTEIPNSTFDAEVDELRIWSRKSNPSLINKNAKINPTSRSYKQDLVHLFKFDNLSNHFAKDEVSSLEFRYQQWYPGSPQYSDLDIDEQIEVKVSSNQSLMDQAAVRCQGLLYSGPIYSQCKELHDGIVSYFYELCITDIARTGDPYAGIFAVASFARHCKTMLQIDMNFSQELCSMVQPRTQLYLVGTNCSHVCVYGTWSVDKSMCICEPGYWGTNCSFLCPGGILNTCNNRGVCDKDNGSCSCHGNQISEYVNDTWKLPCSECKPGWKGVECDIAEKEMSARVQNKNRNSGLCFAFGTMHFRTLDGTSFDLDLQGMYMLIGNEETKVFITMKSCGLNPSCRRITEIYVTGKFGDVSVTFANGYLRILSRKRGIHTVHGIWKGSLSEIKPSVNWQSILRDTTMRLTGSKEDRAEIRAGENYFLRVLLRSNDMSILVDESFKKGCSSGICSFSLNKSSKNLEPSSKFMNGSYVNSVRNSSAISISDIVHEVTMHHFWKNQSDSLLSNASRYTQEGPGYMLFFSHSRVEGTLLSLHEVLNEWTFDLWIHPSKPTYDLKSPCSNETQEPIGPKQTILSLEHDGNRYLSLKYAGRVYFEWDEFSLASSFVVRPLVWTHIAVSWRSYDGRLQMQASSDCLGLQISTDYVIKLGATYSWNGTLVIGQYVKNGRQILENDFIGAVDEFRIWAYAKSSIDIQNISKQRVVFPKPGLLLAGYFDQTYGENIPVLLAPNSKYPLEPHNQTVIARIFNMTMMPKRNVPEVLPSTVSFELPSSYSLVFRTSSIEAAAFEICHQKFYSGVLQQYCSINLPQTALFLFHACISDIASTENLDISTNSEIVFAVLCNDLIETQACRLRSIYDGFPMCPDVKEGSTWTSTRILLLILAVILALIVIIAATFYFRMKRNGHPQVNPVSGDKYRCPEDDIALHDQEPLFVEDSFKASSLRDLSAVTCLPDPTDLGDVARTSNAFLEPAGRADLPVFVERAEKTPGEKSLQATLINYYEETETEF